MEQFKFNPYQNQTYDTNDEDARSEEPHMLTDFAGSREIGIDVGDEPHELRRQHLISFVQELPRELNNQDEHVKTDETIQKNDRSFKRSKLRLDVNSNNSLFSPYS